MIYKAHVVHCKASNSHQTKSHTSEASPGLGVPGRTSNHFVPWKVMNCIDWMGSWVDMIRNMRKPSRKYLCWKWICCVGIQAFPVGGVTAKPVQKSENDEYKSDVYVYIFQLKAGVQQNHNPRTQLSWFQEKKHLVPTSNNCVAHLFRPKGHGYSCLGGRSKHRFTVTLALTWWFSAVSPWNCIRNTK